MGGIAIWRLVKRGALGAACCAACMVIAGCGGGGGTGGGAAAVPSNPPLAMTSLSGTVTDDASPSPGAIAGAAVAVYPTGVPLTSATPLAQATTAPNGTWSIATGPVAGTYLLQIAPADSAHATLHKDVTLTADANAIGTTQLTILSSMEQQCVADFNLQRKALGVSTLTVDNAAMIAARAEAVALASWNGQGTSPNVEPTTYANAGGVGTVPGYAGDLGASDCTMATSNMFGAGTPQTVDGNPKAAWFGFGVDANVTIGSPPVPGNPDYAATVIQYP